MLAIGLITPTGVIWFSPSRMASDPSYFCYFNIWSKYGGSSAENMPERSEKIATFQNIPVIEEVPANVRNQMSRSVASEPGTGF